MTPLHFRFIVAAPHLQSAIRRQSTYFSYFFFIFLYKIKDTMAAVCPPTTTDYCNMVECHTQQMTKWKNQPNAGLYNMQEERRHKEKKAKIDYVIQSTLNLFVYKQHRRWWCLSKCETQIVKLIISKVWLATFNNYYFFSLISFVSFPFFSNNLPSTLLTHCRSLCHLHFIKRL